MGTLCTIFTIFLLIKNNSKIKSVYLKGVTQDLAVKRWRDRDLQSVLMDSGAQDLPALVLHQGFSKWDAQGVTWEVSKNTDVWGPAPGGSNIISQE